MDVTIIEELIGKVIVNIHGTEDEELILQDSEGGVHRFYHDQDC